jgi:flap endonuclease-1
MGFNLSPLVVKQHLTLNDLRGKMLAVDASNMLYQFLALIRMRDGSPFTDSQGHVTSHLLGLTSRTTRLMADYGIRQVSVFDGKPPELKSRTLGERRESRNEARKEWEEAVSRSDYATAWSKAVRMSRLTQAMQDDAKKVLGLMGIPYVLAPQEGEAQAAYMARVGDVWAANSRDYDSVLFGAPRLVRYVTIAGQKYLPSKSISRPLIPELIDLETLLRSWQITREQLVDLAILVGTDFNTGIHGIGPKTALKLIKTHGCLENLPSEIRTKLPESTERVRGIFLHPEVTDQYNLQYSVTDEAGLIQFLCKEREFSRDKVDIVIERMRIFRNREKSKLSAWFNQR